MREKEEATESEKGKRRRNNKRNLHAAYALLTHSDMSLTCRAAKRELMRNQTYFAYRANKMKLRDPSDSPNGKM
jgi:hypothetical protein